MMHIAGSIRPLSVLDDLELRRDRLAELIDRKLVTPLMAAQLGRAVDELDRQIAAARAVQWGAPMSMAA
jgi:hypothetical protein